MSWCARGALVAFALTLSCCAKPVRDIQPAMVDPSAFAGDSCPQLAAKRARLSQALVFRGFAQDQVSADDRAGIFGAPMLMGTMFDGNNEAAVSELKGELRAVNSQILAMNCGLDHW